LDWNRFFFDPDSGAFVIVPSIDTHDQSIPLSSSYAINPAFQKASNTPAFVHSINRRWAELLEQIPVAFNAFHWQPVRSTNKIAVIADRLLTRRR
jgi:hypothetical protein